MPLKRGREKIRVLEKKPKSSKTENSLKKKKRKKKDRRVSRTSDPMQERVLISNQGTCQGLEKTSSSSRTQQGQGSFLEGGARTF